MVRKLGSLHLWLLAAFVTLAVGLMVLPTVQAPSGAAWRYQLPPKLGEAPFVSQAHALVVWSTERVRDVFRFNLLSWNAGGSLPVGASGPAVSQAFTAALAGALLLVVWARGRRGPAVAGVLAVLFALHLVANPAGFLSAVSWPSEVLPRTALTLVGSSDTGQKAGTKGGREAAMRSLADRYHREYVTFTQVRMRKAGTTGAELKRLWFGLSGLAYVFPFALVIVILAMATTVLQTVSLLLLLFGLVAIPGRLTGRLSPYTFAYHWLRPLIAAHIALFVSAVLTLWAMLGAINVHAAENEVFVLAAGSSVPVGLAVLFWVFVVRKALQRGTGHVGRSSTTYEGDATRPLPARYQGGAEYPRSGHGWRIRR